MKLGMPHSNPDNAAKRPELRPACSAKLSLRTVIMTIGTGPRWLFRWRVVGIAAVLYAVVDLVLSTR